MSGVVLVSFFSDIMLKDIRRLAVKTKNLDGNVPNDEYILKSVGFYKNAETGNKYFSN